MSWDKKKIFKHPIGYFLIDKLGSEQQAQIVNDGITLLSESGFNVMAVVCDGAFANQATATRLGCVLKPDDVKTKIQHPSDSNKHVNMIFDACHLIKNVRNCFGDLGIIRVGEEQIKWKYITELHKFQQQSNLHIANKLQGKHLDYVKNKMNVSLATQTISSSVDTAIEFLRDDLSIPEFSGSEATCRFLRMFDKLFDLCNSSNSKAKGFKSPITPLNFNTKKKFISEAIQYIKSLKDTNQKPLVRGRRKTGFIGFIATLQSLQAIAADLLSKGYKYVLTYRLSQDHLETLFSRIRGRGGWNNNPNVLQFKYALRALLQKNGILPSEKGNCVSLPCDNNLHSGENSVQEDEVITDPKCEFLIRSLEKPSPYHSDVLYYICGYISRKIIQKNQCDECRSYLITTRDKSPPQAARLTVRRDNGGLLYGNKDMFSIIVMADKVLRHLLISEKGGPFRSVNEKTIMRVALEVSAALGSKVFLGLKEHRSNCHLDSEDDHPSQILKEACNIFCRTILYHHGKLFTQRTIQDNSASVRHKLNKHVLFLHQ